MKKRIIILGTICATLAFFTFASDPLQILLNFIIGGVVPGVDITLGFLPSLIVIASLLIIARAWIRGIRADMIKRATTLNKIDHETKEFNQQHATDTKKDRSAIAAPFKRPASL